MKVIEKPKFHKTVLNAMNTNEKSLIVTCGIEILGADFKTFLKNNKYFQLNWLGEKNQSEPVSLGTELFRSSKTALESEWKQATLCRVRGETQNKLLKLASRYSGYTHRVTA